MSDSKCEMISVDAIFGHIEIKSWIKFEGDKMIGMGSTTTYDRDGNVTDYKECPTGLVGGFS